MTSSLQGWLFVATRIWKSWRETLVIAICNWSLETLGLQGDQTSQS